MAVNRVSVEAIDPLGKSLGVANDFGITPRASDHRAPGAASCGFVQRGAGPLSYQRQDTHRRWVAEGVGAVDGEKSVLEWTRVSAARNRFAKQQGSRPNQSAIRHFVLNPTRKIVGVRIYRSN